MNGQRVLAVVLLVASLFVIGTMSSSLTATVTSTPDDVIDVDTDQLPFMGDGASELADSYQNADEGTPQRDQSAADEGTPPDDGAEAPPPSNDDSGGEPPENAQPPPDGEPAQDGGPPNDGSGGQGGDGGQDGAGSSGGTGPGQGAGDPAQSLWDLLRPILLGLLSLLAAAILVAAGYFLYRRRHQLLARLRELVAAHDPRSSGDGSRPAGVGDDVEDPATVVEHAWGEMVRKSGVRPPRSDTPRECARSAVDAGVAREPVQELTDLYELVRYGERPVTPDEASRALVRLREVSEGAGDVVATEDGPENRRERPGRPTTVSDGGAVTDREGQR